MRFFRREQRFAWLALFALAAQLVLSFGHIHVHAQQAAHAAAPGSCIAGAHAQCPSHDDDETRCSTCWTIAIAGSLVIPAPAALVIPAAAAETVEPQPSTGTHADSQTVHFLARAPPRAGPLA
jgi:hypothetical protein